MRVAWQYHDKMDKIVNIFLNGNDPGLGCARGCNRDRPGQRNGAWCCGASPGRADTCARRKGKEGHAIASPLFIRIFTTTSIEEKES